MNTDLPALPEPAHTFYIGDGKKPKAKYETFSAKQMLAFRAEAIAARDAEIARLGKLAADYFSAAVEAQELAEGLSAETARLQAALAAQQPAAVPSAHDIRAIVQQAYMALEELQGPGFLIGGVMHYRIGLILPKLNEAIDMLAAAPAVQPSDLQRECDAVDFLLQRLGLDPARCRTDGGAINLGRVKTLLAEKEQPAEAVALTEAGIKRAIRASGIEWLPVSTEDEAVGFVEWAVRTFAAAPSAQPVAVPQGWALETGTGGFGGKGDRWVCVRHSASQCWQDFYEGRDPVIFGFLNALAAAPSAPQKGDAA